MPPTLSRTSHRRICPLLEGEQNGEDENEEAKHESVETEEGYLHADRRGILACRQKRDTCMQSSCIHERSRARSAQDLSNSKGHTAYITICPTMAAQMQSVYFSTYATALEHTRGRHIRLEATLPSVAQAILISPFFFLKSSCLFVSRFGLAVWLPALLSTESGRTRHSFYPECFLPGFLLISACLRYHQTGVWSCAVFCCFCESPRKNAARAYIHVYAKRTAILVGRWWEMFIHRRVEAVRRGEERRRGYGM